MPSTLLWFRQDLRLQDNAALAGAIRRGAAVVPVFILDDAAEGRWALGAASRWWLHHSLASLDASLRAQGLRLILRRGDSAAVLCELVKETGADAVYWNRRYEPAAIRADASVTAALRETGVAAESFCGALLHEPEVVRNREGRPFQVFTPFWRHCFALPVEPPVKPELRRAIAPSRWPRSMAVEELSLLPRIRWDREFDWTPGEEGARTRLKRFLASAVEAYATARDLVGLDGTSVLSPHLRFGEITPRQIWAAVQAGAAESGVFPPDKGTTVFLQELGWREFGYHLLAAFPHTPEQPLRPAFAAFEWAKDPGSRRLRAWQRGRTGYPIVDAGMRQLWRTGWMHNRARMICASFLVKHLRLPWTDGAAWFWDTLVDADLANNTLGWQWSAGCGADAAPYFRIFAPVAQGEKFDADGAYVRRWVPELARVPARYIHAPWLAPVEVLAAAGVTLGENYPRPVVDHATARAEALAAFQKLRDVPRA